MTLARLLCLQHARILRMSFLYWFLEVRFSGLRHMGPFFQIMKERDVQISRLSNELQRFSCDN